MSKTLVQLLCDGINNNEIVCRWHGWEINVPVYNARKDGVCIYISNGYSGNLYCEADGLRSVVRKQISSRVAFTINRYWDDKERIFYAFRSDYYLLLDKYDTKAFLKKEDLVLDISPSKARAYFSEFLSKPSYSEARFYLEQLNKE